MVPWSTYTGTNLETADTAKEDLQLIGISSTRREGDFSTTISGQMVLKQIARIRAVIRSIRSELMMEPQVKAD